MKRRYTAGEFAGLVETIRGAIPEVAITTDVIAGFPGETDVEFQETLDFVAAMRFARVHIFPYSSRPGTPAAQFSQQVPAPVKHQRSQMLSEVAHQPEMAFRSQFIGRTLEVLWETQNARGEWSGLTDNYIRVLTRSSSDLSNQIVPVRIIGLSGHGLAGEILSTE